MSKLYICNNREQGIEAIKKNFTKESGNYVCDLNNTGLFPNEKLIGEMDMEYQVGTIYINGLDSIRNIDNVVTTIQKCIDVVAVSQSDKYKEVFKDVEVL